MASQRMRTAQTTPNYDVFLRNYIELREQPPWSYEEDIQFEAVVAEHLNSFTRSSIPWIKIQSEHFPQRTVWELKGHLHKLWFDIEQILADVIHPVGKNTGPDLMTDRKNDFRDFSGMDLDAPGEDGESNPSLRTIPKFASCPQLPSHTANKRPVPTRTPPASHPDLPSQTGGSDENLFFSKAYQASKLRTHEFGKNSGNIPAASLRKYIIADRKKKSLEARHNARTKLTQKPTHATSPGFW